MAIRFLHGRYINIVVSLSLPFNHLMALNFGPFAETGKRRRKRTEGGREFTAEKMKNLVRNCKLLLISTAADFFKSTYVLSATCLAISPSAKKLQISTPGASSPLIATVSARPSRKLPEKNIFATCSFCHGHIPLPVAHNFDLPHIPCYKMRWLLLMSNIRGQFQIYLN